MTTSDNSAPTLEDLKELQNATDQLREELSKVIVGQQQVIDQILISLLSGGHSLLVGVPGLAKTMLVKSLADVLELSFNRIQFTPDLMPADITGTEVIQEDRSTGQREFRFIPGPIFTQVLLADEINRTPPKTQAALLEAMQERQVTANGQRHPLPDPFFVLATQNPIEQEGTYPLPEAQLDRFMLEIQVDYPNEDDEFEIVQRRTSQHTTNLNKVIDPQQLVRFREVIHSMPMADHDVKYAIALVRATRAQKNEAAEEISQYLSWGAGPRASEWLVLAAKAHAAVTGRELATATNVQAMLLPILRHRLVLNFNAEADGLTTSQIVEKLIESVPGPGNEASQKFLKRFITKVG